jgi:hypothetical protein
MYKTLKRLIFLNVSYISHLALEWLSDAHLGKIYIYLDASVYQNSGMILSSSVWDA